jgi:hypothetical protein
VELASGTCCSRASAAVASNSYRRNWSVVVPIARPLIETTAPILTDSSTKTCLGVAASADAGTERE